MSQIYSGIDRKSKQTKKHVRNGENYYTCLHPLKCTKITEIQTPFEKRLRYKQSEYFWSTKNLHRHKIQNDKHKATNIKRKAIILINQMFLKSNKSRKTE